MEPDFFVRDMLSWALTRLPSAITLPSLHKELGPERVQARRPALHTLSKINDKTTWSWITRDMQLSLGRVLVALGQVIKPALEDAAKHPSPEVAAHARATELLRRDPEAGFDAAIHEAKRMVAPWAPRSLPRRSIHQPTA